jgi:hypothetical protein
LLIFGLIPSSKYPDDILDIMDNPWIFAIILIINFYILYWDLTIGLLLFISLIALMLDIIIFTDGELFNDDANSEIVGGTTVGGTTVGGTTVGGTAEAKAVGGTSEAKAVGGTAEAKAVGGTADVKADIIDNKKEYLFNKSYKDINDIVIGKLREYKELSENDVKAYNSFI